MIIRWSCVAGLLLSACKSEAPAGNPDASTDAALDAALDAASPTLAVQATRRGAPAAGLPIVVSDPSTGAVLGQGLSDSAGRATVPAAEGAMVTVVDIDAPVYAPHLVSIVGAMPGDELRFPLDPLVTASAPATVRVTYPAIPGANQVIFNLAGACVGEYASGTAAGGSVDVEIPPDCLVAGEKLSVFAVARDSGFAVIGWGVIGDLAPDAHVTLAAWTTTKVTKSVRVSGLPAIDLVSNRYEILAGGARRLSLNRGDGVNAGVLTSTELLPTCDAHVLFRAFPGGFADGRGRHVAVVAELTPDPVDVDLAAAPLPIVTSWTLDTAASPPRLEYALEGTVANADLVGAWITTDDANADHGWVVLLSPTQPTPIVLPALSSAHAALGPSAGDDVSHWVWTLDAAELSEPTQIRHAAVEIWRRNLAQLEASTPSVTTGVEHGF
ncbi:MAG: hypothetical protein SFX73_17475 [Kofleriaceae bacterium]|nr:hypothetical protein [Kofleriaceae bacterium]